MEKTGNFTIKSFVMALIAYDHLKLLLRDDIMLVHDSIYRVTLKQSRKSHDQSMYFESGFGSDLSI